MASSKNGDYTMNIIPQWLVFRKTEDFLRIFSVVNFCKLIELILSTILISQKFLKKRRKSDGNHRCYQRKLQRVPIILAHTWDPFLITTHISKVILKFGQISTTFLPASVLLNCWVLDLVSYYWIIKFQCFPAKRFAR